MDKLKTQYQHVNRCFRFSDRARRMAMDLIVYAFVLLFVYSAAAKLMELENFKRILLQYPVIGNLNKVFAYLVPIVELLISMILIIPATARIGLICSFLLILLFLVYIIYLLISGSELPCSCGGLISRLSWTQHIWFNSVLVILSFIGIKLFRS